MLDQLKRARVTPVSLVYRGGADRRRGDRGGPSNRPSVLRTARERSRCDGGRKRGVFPVQGELCAGGAHTCYPCAKKGLASLSPWVLAKRARRE
jgi:hypothetical protein